MAHADLEARLGFLKDLVNFQKVGIFRKGSFEKGYKGCWEQIMIGLERELGNHWSRKV